MNKLYEEIDKAIEMGFGNERYFTARVLREAKAKIVELEAEVERLREELRWRKWPEDVPEDNAEYWVMKSDPLNDNGKLYGCVMEGWEIAEHSDKSWKAGLVLYFRPIGELPTEQEGGGDE